MPPNPPTPTGSNEPEVAPSTSDGRPATVKRSSKRRNSDVERSQAEDQDYATAAGSSQSVLPTCDFCRRRDEPCDGAAHCATCLSRSLKCTYDDSPWAAPGGAQEATALDAASRTHVSNSLWKAAPRKRGQISQVACNFCRDRRKKCSGERPRCSNCVKRAVECMYATAPRRRKGGRRRPRGAGDESGDSSHSGAEDGVRKEGEDSGEDEATGSQRGTKTRTPSPPPVPLHLQFPGKGLSESLNHSEEPVGPPCRFCKQMEMPCSGHRPSCVNCTKRFRRCQYDNPVPPRITASLPPVKTLERSTPAQPRHANAFVLGSSYATPEPPGKDARAGSASSPATQSISAPHKPPNTDGASPTVPLDSTETRETGISDLSKGRQLLQELPRTGGAESGP